MKKEDMDFYGLYADRLEEIQTLMITEIKKYSRQYKYRFGNSTCRTY